MRLPVWETNDISGADAAPQVVGRIFRFPDRERRHCNSTHTEVWVVTSADEEDWAAPGIQYNNW